MAVKVLFLSHKFSPDIGGIESHSEILVTAIHNAGHDVRMLTWSAAAKTDGQEFPFQIIRNPTNAAIIKAHLWADVVVENNPSIRLGWPNLFLSSPKIIAIHTWIARTDGTTGLVDKLKKKYLAKSAKVVSCSNAIRVKSYPESVVIDNPYNNNLFKLMPDTDRDLDFVFLGRLVTDKGVDVLIKAFNLVVKNSQSIKKLSLTIIGNGPEKQQLEQLAFDLGLANNINFTGALTGQNLVNVLNQHKYIVVPSIWEEPFGMVALEGIACGCVPIVSDGGGLPDAVGEAGLVVPRADVNALAQSMQQILNDIKLETVLREKATKHLAKHTPDVIAGQYLKIIETAAGHIN